MRTSLIETETAEQFLAGTLPPAQQLVFRARLLGEPGLQEQLCAQQDVYALLKQHGREKLRHEINEVQQTIFTKPAFAKFRERIRRYFPET
jgi:hypothetical protein